MTTALDAARQHLAELARNGVAARDKPNAFHYGLITQLVAELEAAKREISVPDSSPTLVENNQEFSRKTDFFQND